MKRKRNTELREEVLISSDSEDEEQADTSEDDWEDEDDDEEDDDDDRDEEDDDDDDSDDDEKEDEDEDEDEIDNDDDEDNLSDANYAHSSESEGLPASKRRKKAFTGLYGNRDAESTLQGKRKRTRHKQKPKKGSGHALQISSGEDRKLFADSLNIIRGGHLEKLKLEHCKAYLRHFSLRLTGSKTVLFDRVQEHIELKAYGGMARYPRSTFTINCTGDACTGDAVLFIQKVNRKYSKACGRVCTRVVAGRIVKESYGSDKQQHTFTVEVLWSKGHRALPLLYPLLIKGRNLYRLKTFRQRWANEEDRKRVLQEKHSRGSVARNARDDRVLGKRRSGSNQRGLPDGKSRTTSKRESKSKAKFFQADTAVSKTTFFRGKVWSENTSEETAFRERSVTSLGASSHREYENKYCEGFRTTKCILDIKACFAGRLVGTKGRNIGAIARASGAKLRICENPLNRTLRLVEIIGVPEQVQLATEMVVESFLNKGLPPPVVTKHSSQG